MIFETLQIIREEANAYLKSVGGTADITLNNVATLDQADNEDMSGSGSNILCTLVNIQEEFALKNVTNNRIVGGTVDYRNPKVHLNLYVLYSFVHGTYTEALKGLNRIVQFYQGKRVFTQSNTSFKREAEMSDLVSFKFVVDLYTPSFEELNYIWGTLGGKQYPSVMYKISVLEIEREHSLRKSGTVVGLTSDLNNN